MGSSYHHGNLATVVLDHAIEILEDISADALSLRKIAAHIGVTHNALYRHYKGKEALLAAVAGRGYTLLHQSVTAHDLVTPESFAAGYVRFAINHPHLYELMMRSPQNSQVQELWTPVHNLIATARTVFKDDNQIRQVWAILHGCISLHALGTLRNVETAESLERYAINLAIRAP